jgi:glycosyltransferase involved in cell wall biosynthesis
LEKLSAILIARDEEQNIRACLESIRWIAEIIVVIDSRSGDKTEEIAREFTPNVFVREWEGYSGSKTFALSQATREWVFWIDADELVPAALRAEIIQRLNEPADFVAFRLPRLAFFLGRWIWHSGWYPGHVIRLFRKSRARFQDVLVHEGVQIDGPIGALKNHLLHYTDRDTKNYFRKYDQFTSLAAHQLFERGKKFRIVDLIFRPLILFIKMYLLKQGFRDGIQGLILAVFSANYVFTKYAKLWEKQRLLVEKSRVE